MDRESPLAVVREWQDAVSRRAVERVLEMSDPDVEIIGPRGSGRGHALLRAWLDHARVALRPLRTFARGDVVVVAQHGTWHSPETGEVVGEAGVASLFRIADGRVVRYARYDTLDAALEAAGLGPADEVGSDDPGTAPHGGAS